MFIGTRAIQNNEPLYIFGYSFSIVPTDSMKGSENDSLDPFDIAIIKKMTYEDIQIGDVVVFQGNVQGAQGLVIHRIIDYVEGSGFKTKGDFYNDVDQDIGAQPFVTEENYQGTFTSKITFLKPLASVAASSRNLVFAVLTLLLIVMIVWEGSHLIKTYKTEKEETLKMEHEAKIAELKELNKEKLYQEILEEEKAKLSDSKSSKD